MAKIELIQGPADSGKTRWTLGRCLELIKARSAVTVLLPSQPLISDFKQRLLQTGEIKGALFTEFHTFYSFIRKYNLTAGIAYRELREQQLHIILENYLRSSQSQYPELCEHGVTPGFVGALLRYFKDLEDGAVDDVTVNRLANDGSLQQHSRRLSQIHQLYYRFLNLLLKQGFISREHLILQVCNALHEDETGALLDHAFLIDGFYDFTPLQKFIIEFIADRASYTGITLLHYGSKTFTYVTKTERWLKQLVREKNGEVKQFTVGSTSLPEIEYLFERKEADRQPERFERIEAASPAMEVQEITRRVKRDILTGAFTPDDIAVLYRTQENYYSQFITNFRREGIPFAGKFEMPLGTNPALNALLQWYEVLASNYLRGEMLRWLQSNYIAPAPAATQERLTRIHRITLQAQILEGKSNWEARLQRYLKRINESTGSLGTSQYREDRQIIQQMLHLLNVLPEEKTATWIEHIRDLKTVIDVTHLAEQISPFGSESGDREINEVIARDLRACGKLLEVLDSLERLSEAFKFQNISTEQFVRTLRDVVQNTAYQVEAGKSSGVTLTNIERARGMHWKKVYVVGLIDGVFPVQWRPHPLVKLTDRALINGMLPREMEIVEHRADLAEERLLFYIAVTRATEALQVSTVKGQEDVLPSPFYEELSQFYSKDTPGTDDHSDTTHLITPDYVQFAPEQTWLRIDLLQHLGKLEKFEDGEFDLCSSHFRHLRRVLASRESRKFSIFDGQINSQNIQQDIREKLFHSEAPLSPSQLEVYYTSPFQYFAKYLLHLAEVEEVPEELPPQDRGKMLHSILEQFYSQLADRYDGVIDDLNRSEVMNMLDEIIDAVLDSYQQREIPIPELLFDREKDLLRQYVHNAVEFFADTYPWSDPGMTPERFEVEFGMATERSLPPLEVRRNGESLSFRGVIDRLDLKRETGEFTVVDYKTSRGKAQKDFQSGKALQLQVYAIAAQHLLPEYVRPVRLSYYSLRKNKEDGRMMPDPAEKVLLRRETERLIWQAVDRMVSGEFHPVEGECEPYCPVKSICRCGENRIRMKRAT